MKTGQSRLMKSGQTWVLLTLAAQSVSGVGNKLGGHVGGLSAETRFLAYLLL